MTEDRSGIGRIGWTDLAVVDADRVRDFYVEVAGWTVQAVDMGGYSDYAMLAPGGEAVAGVCHARGANAGLPNGWLVYVNVEDLDRSLARCAELGGSVVQGARDMGAMGRMAVVRDPSGAAFALFEPAGK